jgi:hypothetical protein
VNYIKIIFRPWAYIRIFPRTIDKVLVDIILPLVLSILCVVSIYFLEINGYGLFDDEAAITKIGSFVQTLPGFYLAALAAIATFNKPSMDEFLLGGAINMIDPNGNEIQLTRRRFLTVMFSYLTAQSFVLILFVLLFHSIMGSLIDHFKWTYQPFILVFIAYFIFWQLITITLWGLFYLGEKIHIPNE